MDTESVSDHQYVLMKVHEQVVGPLRRITARKYFLRWCARKTDMNLLCAAANVKTWSSLPQGDMSVDLLADRLNVAMREISDKISQCHD